MPHQAGKKLRADGKHVDADVSDVHAEAEYGFELDADDIKQIEGVLRNKYCGKEGLIGPC